MSSVSASRRTVDRRRLRIAIIGSGFGGIGMALQLQEAGFTNFVIFEKAGEVGGVWRDNTYPGAACDVPSQLYSFSFWPNPNWTRSYSPQDEILEYLKMCARQGGLLERIRFHAEVVSLEYSEQRLDWTLTLASGERETFDVVIPALGQLHHPSVPELPGQESFAGQAFHSARWDHSIDWTTKRVGVLGTGASAIQFVPWLARHAGEVTVFQRSAPWVIRKIDREIGPRERRLYDRFPVLQRAQRNLTFWVLDNVMFAHGGSPLRERMIKRMALRNLEKDVPDPVLRGALTPTDTLGCKRILFSSEWYPSLMQPNVHLVAAGVDRLDATGVWSCGAHYEVDVVVYGTGFVTTKFMMPMTVIGAHGVDLQEQWEQGPEAFLGITIPNMPNLFLLYGPNTNLGHNSIIAMLEAQFGYVLEALETLARIGHGAISVRPEASRAYNERLQGELAGTVWAAGCDSWYTNDAGRIVNNWSDRVKRYQRLVAHWDIADYDLFGLRSEASVGASVPGTAHVRNQAEA